LFSHCQKFSIVSSKKDTAERSFPKSMIKLWFEEKYSNIPFELDLGNRIADRRKTKAELILNSVWLTL